MKDTFPPILISGGIFMAIFGLLSMNAAATMGGSWYRAILYLTLGLLSLGEGISLYLQNDESESWLPLSDLGRRSWLLVVLAIPLSAILVSLTYIITYGGQWYSLLICAASILSMAILSCLNLPTIRKVYSHSRRFKAIDPNLQGMVREAFLLRKVIRRTYRRIPDSRKEFWQRFVTAADEAVENILQAGELATLVKGLSEKPTVDSPYQQIGLAMGEMSDRLVQMEADLRQAIALLRMEQLNRHLDDLKTANQALSDRIEATKEMNSLGEASEETIAANNRQQTRANRLSSR